MKRLLVSLTILCCAVLFTVTLASNVAKACTGILSASNSSATESCFLTSSTPEFCNYNCYCSGSESECNQLDAALGLEAY